MKPILTQFRALLLIMITTIIFTGCQTDKLDNSRPEGNDKEVIFSINVPRNSSPSTFALGDKEENEIKTIEMLLFQAGKVAHNPVFANTITTDAGDNTKKSFSVKLPEGTFDIMIFANSRKAFNGTVINIDELQEDVLARLTVDLPATGWNADGTDAGKAYLIPMWGMRNNLTVGQGATITGIYMHRMLARVDLTIKGTAQETGAFQMTDIKVYNPQTKGRIAPIMTNWDVNGVVNSVITGKATAPTLATGATKGTEISYQSAIATGGKSCAREIYIFEAPKALGHADLTAPYITIKGTFDGIEGWYRIDLANYADMTYLDVLRNSLYKIEIEKVTGTGFPNEEDAKKNRADNIVINVTQWNEYDLGGIVFDGQYQMLVNPTTIELNRLATVKNVVVATDHPELPTLGAWDDIAGTTVLTGGWMTAAITANGTDGNGRKLYDLKITILENTATTAREGYIHVKAGRLTNMVKVTQQNPKVRTIPTGGVLAEPNILAVNSAGELNLDGDGYIVYFRWGSLIALNSNPLTNTFPEAVAWVPGTYSTIHKTMGSIGYQATGNFPTLENLTTAIGDPCRLAMKNGTVSGKYKMPSADHIGEAGSPPFTAHMGALRTDFSGLMTVGGRKGYIYKGYTNGRDTQFYPFTGIRSDNGNHMISERGYYRTTTYNPIVGQEHNTVQLYLSETESNPVNRNVARNYAMPIRCVEDVKATIPTGGVAAMVDILSVDNGALNLDGRGKILLFKWGSLVGLSSDPAVTTYPEAIAWLPPNYNGMGSSFETIPFADANWFPKTNNLQTGVGDPCTLAVKAGSAVGAYKMPAGNPYMGTAPGDYGAWVSISGVNGRWYKEADATNKFFYPSAGYRQLGTAGVPNINVLAHFWSTAVNTATAHSSVTLYFNNTATVTVSHLNDVRTLAFAIRCIK